MLLSIALMLIIALIIGEIFNKLKLPALIGMILTGIILGPFVLNLIDDSILNISAELRKIALIVILLRAGLSLDLKDLKKVGRPAILLSFVPATLEILAITFLAPIFFGLSTIESLILATVIAAVSPAVVVPRMIKLIDAGYGKERAIPSLVMAGASVDDIYVIVLFASFLDMYKGGSFHISDLVKVPFSIAIGVGVGFLLGYLLVEFFKRVHIRDTVKVMIIFCLSFFVVAFEGAINLYVPFSALLAIMSIGIALLKYYDVLALRLKDKFSKIWVLAEIVLFVLVGACVNITVLKDASLLGIALICFALVFRTLGVFLSTLGTNLNKKERLFTAFSYMPKATVQAAIGSIPLAEGVKSGNIILALAVLSILLTAPLGATLIDNTYKKLLTLSHT